jgi:hypothetical protein
MKCGKTGLGETVLVRNILASLQITLAAEVHVAEGQFLLEESVEQRKVSDIPIRNSRTLQFSKGELQNLERR